MDNAAGTYSTRQSNENQYQLWVLASGLAMSVRGVGRCDDVMSGMKPSFAS